MVLYQFEFYVTISTTALCDLATMQLPPGETLIRARDNLTHVQPQVFPKLTMHTLLRPYFKASALPCFETPNQDSGHIILMCTEYSFIIQLGQQ